MVYLIIKNITIKRPNKNLDYKYIGPYLVIKKISENNYKLNLLLRIRIYPIFYISLFKDVININAIKTGQNDVEIKINKYEIKKILNVRIKNGRIEYKVK